MRLDLEGNNGIRVDERPPSPWKAAINRISASIIRSIYRHTRRAHVWRAVRYETQRSGKQKDPSQSEGRDRSPIVRYVIMFHPIPLDTYPCLGHNGWGNVRTASRTQIPKRGMEIVRNSQGANLDGNRIYSISVPL